MGRRGAQTTKHNDTIKTSGLPWGVETLLLDHAQGSENPPFRGAQKGLKKIPRPTAGGVQKHPSNPPWGAQNPIPKFPFFDGCLQRNALFFWRAGLADFWRQFGRMIGKIWFQDGRQMGGLLAPIWAHDWHITSSKRASDGHKMGMSWVRRFGAKMMVGSWQGLRRVRGGLRRPWEILGGLLGASWGPWKVLGPKNQTSLPKMNSRSSVGPLVTGQIRIRIHQKSHVCVLSVCVYTYTHLYI